MVPRRTNQSEAGFGEADLSALNSAPCCQSRDFIQSLVFVKINEKKVTCRVHPNAAKRPGQTMKLMLDMSSAIFFDPNTELQIS